MDNQSEADTRANDWHAGERDSQAPERSGRSGSARGDADPVRPKHDDKEDEDDRSSDKKKSKKDDAESEDDNGSEDDGKKKKGSKWPLIILGIVVLLAAIGGGIWWFLTRNLVSTDDAYTEGRAITIAPQVGGYVTKLAVNDNQFLHKGDLIVQIDPRPYVAARDTARGQLEQAQAELANAKVNLDKARTTYPAQLAQAKGQLAQAQGQLYQAQTDYKRQHSVSKAATTQQSIDQSSAALRSAEGQVEVAKAQVTTAELIPQNIAQAEANVKQLDGQVTQMQGNLEQAELNLSYAHVVAPQDGFVTNRNVEMGNYVQPGAQIMALVTPQVWITANFKETELTRMRPGQRVDISIDAYPDLKLKGYVDSIQQGSGSVFSAFPPQNATGNFVKIVQRVPVKIVIDQGLTPNQMLPLGLSTEPTVHLE